jgi:hypothetical protein
MRLLGATAVTLAIALPACGEERTDDTRGAEDTGAPTITGTTGAPRAAAEVAFVTPRDGAHLSTQFTARVRLRNFTLDAGAIGEAPEPGRGHLHFQLDGGRFDVPAHSGRNGQLADDLGVDGRYSPAGTPEITYSDIPPGTHVLRVSLANHNHTDTGVAAEAEVTVR